jgi:hypothetical protein
VWIESKAIGVASQITPHHVLVRMVWIVGGHRKVGVLGKRLRGDQPCRTIDAAVRPAVVPVSADVVLALQAIERDAGSKKILGNCQPRRAGAENAELLGGRRAISSRRLRTICEWSRHEPMIASRLCALFACAGQPIAGTVQRQRSQFPKMGQPRNPERAPGLGNRKAARIGHFSNAAVHDRRRNLAVL